MNSFNRWLDRFCFKHRGFGIRNLMKYIIIGTAAVYILSMMDTSGKLIDVLTFDPSKIIRGQIWRLISFVLIPDDYNNLLFLALMLYFYYFIGNTLEREWGSAKFTFYYLLGIAATAVYALAVGLLFPSTSILLTNATYINLSLFFAFATLYPEQRVLLFFVIPVKVKWMAYLSAAFSLFAVIFYPFPVKLLPVVAVLNYFLFFFDSIKRVLRGLKHRYSKNTINYKSAVKNAKKADKKNEARGYTRKCAVCGKTDAEYPDMQFRYCSLCDGYFCYCEDHINNHVHIKE